MKEKTINTKYIGITKRLNEAIGYLKGKKETRTQKSIASKLDIDGGNLSKAINGNESYLTEPFLRKFADVFEIDTNWLLTGEGGMIESLNIENENIDYKRPKGKSSIAIHDIQTLPLYDSTATLGLVEIFNNTENGNVIDHISIPNLPKSDGAIFMTGDSMYPLLKSGDIIALKIINPADIIYGEMYYVEYYGSDESSVFKVVKYVKKSDLDKEHIMLVSYNTHHDPTDILKNRIKTIAIVNASIRYNRLG
ncbi:S24 family peptidase [Elizabethkingia anophelis]|uniref:S24 family peptidase n=1 Tax=Elizabethkingia anophelis TaxID=1117645 RepID=UPI00162A0C2B|nr:S24 family peptidase [Elizabethkingia anophelis]